MNTKIIKINDDEKDLKSQLKDAAERITNGGTVVFPTETVYGLGADATNEAAVCAIYDAKGRPSDNPLIIHIAEPSDAEKYAYTCQLYYKLAEKFMPGPLTVILPTKDTIPRRTRGGLDTVAVRCPANKIARTLISLAKTPIAAPSANLSGSPSPTSSKHVIDDMYGRVDAIIDGGDCDFGLESTIVKIDSDSSLTLLRPGRITPEELSEVVSDVKIADAVLCELQDGEKALSPGMKYKHYAPKAPLILLDATPDKAVEYIKSVPSKSVAIIAYTKDINKFKGIDNATVYDFGEERDLKAQAHALFALLRSTDDCNYDRVYAPLPNTNGISLALYNRMIRAAAHKIIRL